MVGNNTEHREYIKVLKRFQASELDTGSLEINSCAPETKLFKCYFDSKHKFK